ncbi:Class I SAM-dependent methyltransferase [Rhodovastum atsumiense]|uniref:Class I SAM-dependent methyltransferase n=1 Tax=Rhodovastum atsumiense TaxID=504468 RepID=A0A5M6ILC6_9PROT|nr:class I SAM-dependent methyltransferase [Rhodovastum atsumiense]KAA5609070.1 class I SAM-dependent methyltransferase [Rhodovastum atsumiense]CAH2602179.1 Class I SAM-dependent methyltransferase [Rhodovastum atsumiense]
MSDPSLDFYDRHATTYVEQGDVNPRLAAFLALLPAGGRILELGSGSGRDALAMLQAGFAVEPTDGSAALARQAEARLGRTVRLMAFDQLEAEQDFDGIYASASLLHARRAALPGIISRLHRALKPGGYAWASFKDGTQEGHDGFGRYYNYLDRAALAAMWSGGAPWSSLAFESWDGLGYDRLPTRWHAVIARR